MARKIRFPEKPVELGTLRTGDIFCLTKGAPYLKKIAAPIEENVCWARILGDHIAIPQHIHTFTKNFLVYFLKHEPNDKRKTAKRVSTGVPVLLFNQA